MSAVERDYFKPDTCNHSRAEPLQEAKMPSETVGLSPLTFPSCEEQLSTHRTNVAIIQECNLWKPGEKVIFDRHQNDFREMFQREGYPIGPQTQIDAYNPSAVFRNPPNEYMALRVQPDRDASGQVDNFGSKVAIVKNVDGQWEFQGEYKFDMEDPFVTEIGGEIYFGGVRLKLNDQKKLQHWETVIYKGKTIPELQKEWVVGPKGMKDLRMLKQTNGNIGWYTRPQGEKGGLGNIGYIEMSPNNFASLSSEEIRKHLEEAPLLPIRFPKGEWGGVNQAQPVEEKNSPYYGMNLLLIHQAMRDREGNRHYYPKVIVHDPNGYVYDFGIIAERSNFPDGPSRNGADLQGVVFPSSLEIIDSNWAKIVTGISDKEIATRIIPNPLRFTPIKYSFPHNQQELLAA